ncbi:MAG: LytTR family DNA-binding domain-containing protein [Devosia sp.]
MNNTPLHFALRRTQARFSAARTWVAIGIIGVLLGLIGPFGTYETMSIAGRVGYWLANAGGGYLVGFFFAVLVQGWLKPDPAWRVALLTGLLSGVPIALFAFGLNVLVFGHPTIDLLSLIVYCVLISMGFAVIRRLAVPAEQRVTTNVPGPVIPTPPALLARLPHTTRGRLLHLAVADHYVDVTTDKGHELVLIRLSDAIAETAPTPGLQVHRSHWVALDAVKRATRQAGKPVLELENGTMVPVSRSYLEAARTAGLISR